MLEYPKIYKPLNVTHAPKCNWCWNCPECYSAYVENLVGNGAARVGGNHKAGHIRTDLASYIDHTVLKADVQQPVIEKLCAEARQYSFASVCVNGTWVKYCSEALRGTSVLVCTVVGFPLGATSDRSKAAETRIAVEDGASEIDMVINVGRLKSGQYDAVAKDIRSVVTAAAPAHVKVIIETCYLTDEEKVKACVLSMEAGAHFVKTSTGFGTGGATAADVALMRRVVGEKLGVKASGGIRNTETAQEMIRAGANRIGASASVEIVSAK